jgi:hypothetical protein
MVLGILLSIPIIIYIILKERLYLRKDWKKRCRELEEFQKNKFPEIEKYFTFFDLARRNYIIYKVSKENPKVAVFLLENMKKTLVEGGRA